MKANVSALLVALGVALGGETFAQNAPFTGKVTVRLQALNAPVVVGDTLHVRVTVDLTGVTGPGPSGPAIAAALGAYVVPVRFDKSLLRFTEARAGSGAGYTAVPKSTTPSNAAGIGEVTIAAAATSAARPTGAVIVGELRFAVVHGGADTRIEVVPQGSVSSLSVASAYFPTGATAGPALIPSQPGAALQLTIPAEVAADSMWTTTAILLLLIGVTMLSVQAARRRKRARAAQLLCAAVVIAWGLGRSVEAAAPFIGDLSRNNVTDATDFGLLQDYLVANAAAVHNARVDLGDIDGNSRIDAVDLALLRAFLDQARALRPTVEITAAPDPALIGTSVTLSWTTTRAASVQINGGPSLGPSGTTMVVPPDLPAVYTITATGSGGTGKSEVAIGKQSSFTLQVVPSGLSIARSTPQQGTFAFYVVKVGSTDGFSEQVQLTAEGLPAGVTAQFIPPRVAPGASADLKISVGTSAPTGLDVFTVRARGSSAGVSMDKTQDLLLGVLGAGTYTSGRVMTSDPVPVPIAGAHISFLQNPSIDATTDAAGNYLFSGSNTPLTSPPDRVIKIDTTTATAPNDGSTFTFVHKAIPVVPNQPNPMPMPFLMPRLNPEPLSPNLPASGCVTRDTVLRSASVPNLEVLLRNGTCLRDHEDPNAPVTQISVTRLEVDRFPGLLPGVDADAVYTLQPEGTRASIPVEVTYPNLRHMNAGTVVDLYALNITTGMFAEIGLGTVSDDGLTVVPNEDPNRPGFRYGMDRLTWSLSEALVGANNLGGEPICDACPAGDPVQLSNGAQLFDFVDLEVRSGLGSAAVERVYRTRSIEKGPWGKGTSSNIDMILVPGGPDPSTMQQVTLRLPGGRDRVFTSQGGGVFRNASHPNFIGDEISGSLDFGTIEVRFQSGETWGFEGLRSGPERVAGRIRYQFDRNGNAVRVQRTSTGFPTRIVEPGGRFIDITWNEAAQGGMGLITKIRDTLGREVLYAYDGSERLRTVTDAAGQPWTYTWHATGALKSIMNPRGFIMMDNEYDPQGRVNTQKRADNGVHTFTYTTSNPMDPNTTVIGTKVTDPMGHTRSYRFTATGFVTELVDEAGNKTVYERDPLTNQIATITDPLGRQTRFTYFAQNGLPATVTDPNDGVTTYAYDTRFALPTLIEDPVGNTIQLMYDASGNATTFTDERGKVWTASYNSYGQLESAMDPNENATAFDYSSSGDLIEARDGEGNLTRLAWDRAGRLIEQADARNQATRYLYDGRSRLTARILPRGATEQYAYDGVGNLIETVDANGNTWTLTYDKQNRLATVSDPRDNQESYAYDQDDLLTSWIDRRGRSESLTYDARHLRTQSLATGAPTLTFQYDAAGRLIRAQDSVSGPIDLEYDRLDNLTAETTSAAVVTSKYDAASRRRQVQVGSDTPVGFQYDPNSALLAEVSHGASIYSFGYDESSRLISLTRPNNVVTDYTYDHANRLVQIAHRRGATPLETIGYQYEATGRPAVRESSSPTLAPQPFQALYASANRLASTAGQTMEYDENGNLVSDGISVYTYDARNRLIAVTGPGVEAAFEYDAFDRRIGKTINGITMRYVYDGLSVIQERLGTSSNTTLISAGLDFWLARTSAGAATYLLEDMLGSVVAEIDGPGNVISRYAYDPFGRTELAGAASANPFRFTGREDDGAGHYYYRARYYRPGLQRFLAEDPIRRLGGDLNFYAYVQNNPVAHTDPLGLHPFEVRPADLNRVAPQGSALGQNQGALNNLLTGPAQARAACKVGRLPAYNKYGSLTSRTVSTQGTPLEGVASNLRVLTTEPNKFGYSHLVAVIPF